ncbi:intradiol ring-cleavage dioxygenase [Streptomyces sp. NPDC005962]|uniref:intradiol ring-cleavage dioxygenase n=1 Tax=Streptomyces sp. NPDC005962 TaxID=3154466 RepID=UPI0033F85BDF
MTEPQKNTPVAERDMTRRRVVVAGGAAVAAAGLGTVAATSASASPDGSSAATPSASASSPSQEVCYRLTSETTEGPYYIDADKIRKNITEGKAGIPMTLRLKLIDSETCKPLAKAAVDIWHCDALGLYSGYEDSSSGGGTPPTGAPPTGTPTDTPTGEPTGTPPTGGPPGGGGGHQDPTDDKRYLRGTQLTDRHGFVEFTTVFPGWYRGRCVHIHAKVHVGGKLTDSGYEGGHACHTGQLFFAEEAVLASAEVAPYSTSTTPRTTLDEDGIYPGNGAEGGLLKLQYRKGKIAKGVVGSLTLGVDPDATNEGTGM